VSHVLDDRIQLADKKGLTYIAHTKPVEEVSLSSHVNKIHSKVIGCHMHCVLFGSVVI
jgi:hypothetical protein